MTVLLVCNSRLVGERLTARLSQLAGVTVLGQFRNAEDALQFIKVELPDIVIVDAHLVGATSMILVRMLKSLAAPPVVVAVSTSSYQQYYRQSMKEGADFCFHLPDEFDKLTGLLEGMN